VLADFRGQVGEVFRIRPKARGVAQSPPLPLVVEMGPGITAEPAGLRERLVEEIKTRLLVTVDLQLVPYGSLPRDTYKSRLVEHPAA
jgi:phenylacetate-CoA ligase